jgi:hypothetical protein
MPVLRFLPVPLIAVPAVAILACGGRIDGRNPAPAPSETTTAPNPTPATAPTAIEPTPAVPDGGELAYTYLRIVDVQREVGALDICFSPSQDFSASRPVLGGAGVSYGQVTPYIAVPVTTAALVFVAAGQTDCSAPFGDPSPVWGGRAGDRDTAITRGASYFVSLDATTTDDGAVGELAVTIGLGVDAITVGTGSRETGDFVTLATVSSGSSQGVVVPSGATVSGYASGGRRVFLFPSVSVGSGDVASLRVVTDTPGGPDSVVLCTNDLDETTPVNPTCRVSQ